MLFSKACEYAIRAALYISAKSIEGSRLGISEIAEEIDAPVAFTAKILQTLAREGIISSIKGPNGGFFIEPKAKPIRLITIVKAIDGEKVLSACVLGLKECSDEFPCPVHKELKPFKDRVKKIIEEKTIQDLSADLTSGSVFLKRKRTKR
ncbi:MAG: Rrf2 family transcriptional regulator [Cyclobacteriaceae bacterium]|jgi:Rrf2 family protein|nr:Rrf2 family transcriptional regulator [Cyclobacteriaceae bacterium]